MVLLAQVAEVNPDNSATKKEARALPAKQRGRVQGQRRAPRRSLLVALLAAASAVKLPARSAASAFWGAAASTADSTVNAEVISLHRSPLASGREEPGNSALQISCCSRGLMVRC